MERDRQDDPSPSADPLKPLFKAGPPSTGTVRPDRLRLTGGTAVRAFRILALFILTPSVVAAQASIWVLEDFERDDALEAWQLRQIDAVVELAADSVGSTVTSLAAAAAREPDRRLRLTYQKWQAGQNKWPSARLSFGDGLFDLDDWSGYETLLFEAWNSHSRTALVKIRIDDADGDRSIQLVAVPPRVWTTCEIRLDDLRSNTDLDAIRLLDAHDVFRDGGALELELLDHLAHPGGVEVGELSIVGSGAVVLDGMKIPARTVVTGVPARPRSEIEERHEELIRTRAINYAKRSKIYKDNDLESD